MNFLQDDVKTLYFKYLSASLLSALVVSIYAFVDTIAIGQSEGPAGTAAMAVITPLYGLFAFFSIICGIGGSIQLSKAKGEGNEEKGNAYFTSALIIMAVIVAVFWIILFLFHKQIFIFFGADNELMPKIMSYAKWMLICFPIFIAPTFLGAFIRNDGAPTLAMIAVMVGGCINIFGDWFLVFPLGMGMEGAAIASVSGVFVQFVIMCTHFFGKKCNLKLVRPFKMSKSIRNILKIGFGSGVIELSTVIFAILMNNQIMKYAGTTELAVYGVLITIFQLFSAMFCGVGQAIQPLVSSNYGAGNHQRNKQFWNMSLLTVIFFGFIFTFIGELFPVAITQIFIDATPEVIRVSPMIFRLFFLLFIPSGITVLSIYYLQSTARYKMSMIISILKGIAVSGLLILILPIIFDIYGVWIALPCSELFVAIVALYFIKKKENKYYL